jgi:DNA-directed RNA polymerase specialized sigma24 family protein
MKTKTNIQGHFLAAYDSFVNEIFLFFLSRTRKRDVAKDLTQETFLKTWRDISDNETNAVPLQNIHVMLRRNARSLMGNSYQTI